MSRIKAGMAENIEAPSATAQAPAGESPTQIAPNTQAIETPTGAGLSNEFLADLGYSVPVEKKPSGDEATKAPAKDGEQSATTAKAEDETPDNADDDKDEVPEKDKNAKVPEWVTARLSKNSEQKKALREEVAALKEKAEAAEKALAETAATVPTILPPSPLAHLDTPEALESESEKVVNFMKAAKAPDFVTKYKDYDEDTGTSATFDQNQAYALFFLENQNAHAKTLTTKKETTEAVRKANPTLFDGKSAESAERRKLYLNDPRTLPDYDQFIADALAGRNARLAKAKAPEQKTEPVTAKPKTNGSSAKEAPPVYTLPAASRSLATSDSVPDARAVVMAKSRTKTGVSLEEMMDAGAIR